MFELPWSWQADHENPTCSQFDCQAFEDCITASCIVCTEEYRPMFQCVVKRDCSITCEYNICADSKPEEAHWCSQEAPQVPTQPSLSPRMGDSSVPSNINRLLNMILFDASFDTVWLLNFCPSAHTGPRLLLDSTNAVAGYLPSLECNDKYKTGGVAKNSVGLDS